MTNEEFIESIRLEGEEWRDVVGWEGYYMVSSYGRILSVKRNLLRKNGSPLHIDSRILKPNTTNHNGILYNYICLRKECKRVVIAIHRIVAESFIPNPYEFSDVDHIDRNGLNNRVENLRWCTRSMNMQNEKTKLVFSASQRGKSLPTLEKSVVQIQNGVIIKSFRSISEAGKNGFSIRHIINVCKNRYPLYKGYRWMYLTDYKSLVNQ